MKVETLEKAIILLNGAHGDTGICQAVRVASSNPATGIFNMEETSELQLRLFTKFPHYYGWYLWERDEDGLNHRIAFLTDWINELKAQTDEKS
jgi:hypothetical protein